MTEQRMRAYAGLQEQHEIMGDNTVIRDETSVHHYKPESNWQYLEQGHNNSPTKKKSKVQPPAGKIMCPNFWEK
jgi:hypothetical protein